MKLRFLRLSSHDTLHTPPLFVPLPGFIPLSGRLVVMFRCNSITAPGLLINRYTLSSGSLARRQLVLPSAQVTPVETCSALRLRWYPAYSPLRMQDCCLPARSRPSAFILTCIRVILMSTTIHISGLNHAAYALAPSGFGLPLPGLPADVTSDLLAKL